MGRSRLPITLSALAGSLLGCGGGGGGSATMPATANLTGIWNIQLSENQYNVLSSAGAQATGVTEIDVSLAQSGGVLSAQPNIPAMNVGCRNGGSWAAQSGGWLTAITTVTIFAFNTGTLVDQTVNVSLTETIPGPGGPLDGTLAFTGTVQSDGSLAGSVTDGCTGTSATWTGTRISALP